MGRRSGEDFRKKSMGQPSNMLGVVLDPLKTGISCQYLHFAQTEDIWLKSALKGKRGVSLITRKSFAQCDQLKKGVVKNICNKVRFQRNFLRSTLLLIICVVESLRMGFTHYRCYKTTLRGSHYVYLIHLTLPSRRTYRKGVYHLWFLVLGKKKDRVYIHTPGIFSMQ
jgi:hypothetical protein